MVWMSMGELSAEIKTMCPECEREAGAFVTAYKHFWTEKGETDTGSPASKKANEAKKTLLDVSGITDIPVEMLTELLRNCSKTQREK